MSAVTDLARIPSKIVAKSFCSSAHCLDPLCCHASITQVQPQLLASGLRLPPQQKLCHKTTFLKPTG